MEEVKLMNDSELLLNLIDFCEEETKTKMSYKNAKIYVIRSYKTDNVYIGSTTQSLSKRFALHVGHFKSQKKYYSSFEILKYGDSYIELLEEYPCDTKEQLLRKEGELIRQTNNCVNKVIAGRTTQEYYVDNKDGISEKKKQYYADNKDGIIEKKKQYYIDNKNEIIEKQKKYYADNKDDINKKIKKYQEKNRDKLNTKFQCECGGHYTYVNKTTHCKSIKHTNYTKNDNNNANNNANENKDENFI